MIIGFTGKLGSGKDTAADRFEKSLHGAHIVRGSFAEKLKVSAAACFPDVKRADWEIWKNDSAVKILVVREDTTQDFEMVEYGGEDKFPADILSEQTAREFLQRYGTESHRDVFGQDFWVEQAFSTPSNSFDFLIFTDVRFPNEARAILDKGGHVVRVVGANENTGGHVSEAGLPDELVSYTVNNAVRGDNFENLDWQINRMSRAFAVPSHLFHPADLVTS